MKDKINSLIGKPHNNDNYHCWHLVCDLVPCAPKIDASIGTIREAMSYKDDVTDGKLREIKSPINGCIVLLGKSERTLYHAGVFYSDGIVHNDENGVRYETLNKIDEKFPFKKYMICR